jgi:signal recognition particle GTPase
MTSEETLALIKESMARAETTSDKLTGFTSCGPHVYLANDEEAPADPPVEEPECAVSQAPELYAPTDSRQVQRRRFFFEAFAKVTQRDGKYVVRQGVHVGWHGDTRSERRKQARALAKKSWKLMQVELFKQRNAEVLEKVYQKLIESDVVLEAVYE